MASIFCVSEDLHDDECPECGSGNIIRIMDDVGDGGFRHENCGCNDCNSSWYNHYKLYDQETVVRRGVRL